MILKRFNFYQIYWALYSILLLILLLILQVCAHKTGLLTHNKTSSVIKSAITCWPSAYFKGSILFSIYYMFSNSIHPSRLVNERDYIIIVLFHNIFLFFISKPKRKGRNSFVPFVHDTKYYRFSRWLFFTHASNMSLVISTLSGFRSDLKIPFST